MIALHTRQRVVSLAILLLAGCESSPPPAVDFAFERLDQAGAVYAGSGDFQHAPWNCVRDRNTGLVWEVKTAGAGLRTATHTYSWYAPDNEHDGAQDYRGTPNGGQCSGTNCDTAAYVHAVNAEGLCGFNDWRMPTKDEFATISDPRPPLKRPTIDSVYFPETQIGEYWTANDYAFKYDAAWAWHFEFSHDRVDWKKTPKYVRLVRGTQLPPAP
ncbi:MAG: DUF1566 domain-containing protein [Gammaproteobacteria bacterium]|nr:DUF1566 domain-containing protein [Gammaproteobacteria bacterium]